MRLTPLLLLPLLLTIWPTLARAQAIGGASLTLEQANAEAFEASPAIRLARQNLAQAEARIGQAQAQRHLQITFNSAISGSNASVLQPPPANETFGTLQNTLTVPLPLGAKPRLVMQQAQEQFLSVQAQFDAARLALAGQVASAYFDLLRKQALRAVAQETLAQVERALGDARKRNRAGDVAQIDVLQAQVPVASAQATLEGAENDLEVARQTLNSLLGQPLDAPLIIADIAPDLSPFPFTLDQARVAAAQRSPDVRAAEAGVRAAEFALAAARTYREPALSLQATDIRSSDQTSFSREDTVQAAVTLPLSDGGLGREQVREAEAALAGAKAQTEAARITAIANVSAAYLTAQSRRRQVVAARIAQEIAQTTYDKTVQGYQNGLFPLTQVLNAQAALTQARIAYTQAVYDAAAATSALTTAYQGATVIPSISSPPTPAPPTATGAGGTAPAGAGSPTASPSGNTVTGTGTGGTTAGGGGKP